MKRRKMTRPEQQAMFARLNAGRSQGAINRDLSVRAAETLPNTPENVKLWKQDPRRIDIEGIDTPSDMKTVLIIQSAKPYPDDLKIGSREEFYDEKLWYDPDRGRHPASGSGRLPTKHVPFYEVVDVGGKNKWKVVNPYTGEIKYYPYGEHNAAKAYYNGLYDDYLKSEGAPNAPKMWKAEPVISKSPYKDLTIIADGEYHKQVVDYSVAKDADKLFEAIYDNDMDAIIKYENKYHKAFLTGQKSGTTRNRYIRQNAAKITIHNLALHARSEIEKFNKENNIVNKKSSDDKYIVTAHVERGGKRENISKPISLEMAKDLKERDESALKMATKENKWARDFKIEKVQQSGAPSAPTLKHETAKQKHERESNYMTRDQVDDMPYRKLNKSRLDPTIDYLPNETDAEIQHVITVKDKPSQHGVVYHDKYIMLAEHSAKKREIKPIPPKH